MWLGTDPSPTRPWRISRVFFLRAFARVQQLPGPQGSCYGKAIRVGTVDSLFKPPGALGLVVMTRRRRNRCRGSGIPFRTYRRDDIRTGGDLGPCGFPPDRCRVLERLGLMPLPRKSQGRDDWTRIGFRPSTRAPWGSVGRQPRGFISLRECWISLKAAGIVIVYVPARGLGTFFPRVPNSSRALLARGRVHDSETAAGAINKARAAGRP